MFVFAGRGHHHHHHHHHHAHHHLHHHSSRCRHLSSCCVANKNFNAFLSAIERVHQKDPRSTSTRLENLVEFAREKKDKLHLNNSALVDYCNQVNMNAHAQHRARADSPLRHYVEGTPLIRHKSHLRLLHDKNVELICNNLSRKSSLTSTESEEDVSSLSSSLSSSSTNSSSESSSG